MVKDLSHKLPWSKWRHIAWYCMNCILHGIAWIVYCMVLLCIVCGTVIGQWLLVLGNNFTIQHFDQEKHSSKDNCWPQAVHWITGLVSFAGRCAPPPHWSSRVWSGSEELEVDLDVQHVFYLVPLTEEHWTVLFGCIGCLAARGSGGRPHRSSPPS